MEGACSAREFWLPDTEFKYNPSQRGKGAGIKKGIGIKSGWAKICRKVVKVLNLEERKPQLLVFWFYGNVVSFCFSF